VLYNLAVARRYGGDRAGALQSLDALLARDPEYGRAHQERGHNLLNLNRPAEAAAAFARAVDLNPGLLASWKALAELYAHAGRHDRARAVRKRVEELEALPLELRNATDLLYEGQPLKAEKLCRAFLREHRQHVEAMRLLAEIGVRLKIYDDAEFLLESCVEFEPEHPRARSDYLRILNRKGKFRQALEQAGALMRLEPDNPVHRLSQANALAGVGRFEEAIEGYRQCLEGAANPAGIHLLLGHAQKAVGDVGAAIESYRRAYEVRPEYGDAWWSLANTKTYRFDDDELQRMLELKESAGVVRDDRVHLNFAAGKALEDRGDYAAAFDCYERGNALQRARCGYSPALTAEMVDAQIKTCTRALFAGLEGCGYPAPDPVFILGMPRAGSTLLEQILASHSQVDGTMELHNILGLAQRLRGRTAAGAAQYPANLAEIDADYFRRFGEQFIENTRDYRAGAPLFIDKMPNNFLHIGLIRLILPRAKVIDARRAPMACCFSNFKQLFGEGQEFSYDLQWMGRYYRDYVRLMAHWDEVLPGFVLRVQHEEVLDDLEGQVRRILDFCGLDFEPACLRYYETERAVRTPSSEQVRQPIYTGAADQWQNFAPWLEPLREALGPELAQGAS